jgi:hypothetical protein
MGQDVRQDWAIPLPAMHGLMRVLDDEWLCATEHEHRERLTSIGAYSLIAFCGSFRGPEVFLTDLHGLRKYLSECNEQRRDHLVIPLLGRFKGELNSRYHLAPLVTVTNSGLDIKKWVEHLVQVREKEGRTPCPAFCDQLGKIASSSSYELAIMDRLHWVQGSSSAVIPPDIDVYEHFGISRSFRRGATSEARARGVSDKLVDLVNRWRKFENARGRRPALPMQEHYSDSAILIPELLKFSKAM